MQESRAERKKSHPSQRVSYRKEFAVVTLGMVASIAGLGGLLSAVHPESVASPQEDVEKPALNAPLAVRGDEERSVAPQSTTAAWSASSSQTAPSAVSQGS
jgi:hypothetical protein